MATATHWWSAAMAVTATLAAGPAAIAMSTAVAGKRTTCRDTRRRGEGRRRGAGVGGADGEGLGAGRGRGEGKARGRVWGGLRTWVEDAAEEEAAAGGIGRCRHGVQPVHCEGTTEGVWSAMAERANGMREDLQRGMR